MQLKLLAAFSASALVLKRAGLPLFLDSEEQPINANEAVAASIENKKVFLTKIHKFEIINLAADLELLGMKSHKKSAI